MRLSLRLPEEFEDERGVRGVEERLQRVGFWEDCVGKVGGAGEFGVEGGGGGYEDDLFFRERAT